MQLPHYIVLLRVLLYNITLQRKYTYTRNTLPQMTTINRHSIQCECLTLNTHKYYCISSHVPIITHLLYFSPTKTAERIEVFFGMETPGVQITLCWMEVSTPYGKRRGEKEKLFEPLVVMLSLRHMYFVTSRRLKLVIE